MLGNEYQHQLTYIVFPTAQNSAQTADKNTPHGATPPLRAPQTKPGRSSSETRGGPRAYPSLPPTLWATQRPGKLGSRSHPRAGTRWTMGPAVCLPAAPEQGKVTPRPSSEAFLGMVPSCPHLYPQQLPEVLCAHKHQGGVWGQTQVQWASPAPKPAQTVRGPHVPHHTHDPTAPGGGRSASTLASHLAYAQRRYKPSGGGVGDSNASKCSNCHHQVTPGHKVADTHDTLSTHSTHITSQKLAHPKASDHWYLHVCLHHFYRCNGESRRGTRHHRRQEVCQGVVGTQARAPPRELVT